MKKFFTAVMIICVALAPAVINAAQSDDENPREFKVKGVTDGGAATARETADDSAQPAKKEKIIQAGALEKQEGDKYILRKVQTRVDFYIASNAKIYLKSDGSSADLVDRCYLDIRGPRNKKAILANTVYIYPDKKTYDEMVDKDAQAGQPKKTFSAPVTATLKQKDPLIVTTDDGKDYLVCFDEDTYWISNKTAQKTDLNLGDRIKVYFDKRLSIRYKSEAVKVVIDKSKAIN